MPEISLKEYLGKINSLLNSNAADEVIHHCRHILQYYPKNVTAYRYLGRALVLVGRMEEGRDALRRVLSVIPDDYVAHLTLSEANERLNHPDEAIWHLERALEQRPNDKDLIDALRGLYRRYRGVDNAKIQLTSAAVARQYLRSAAYTQAIDALRRALTRMNDRIDLKLLLAQILWQQGSEEEAADIALDVLKVLPDCEGANRILAQLWLSNDRPSDARRYVNTLESIDPYLAVELVQGTAPSADAFRLEELDYSRSSQSEITRARPDWLQEISATAPPVFENTKEVSSDDWGNWASSLLSSQQAAETQKAPERFVPSGKSTPSEKAAPVNAAGMTDIFGKTEDTNTGELAAIFGDVRPGEEDPMAWLRDTGVELVDQAEETPDFSNLFDDDDGSIPEADNPMAWLQQDAIADDDTGSPAWLNQNAIADDTAGTPAWMNQRDDDLDADDDLGDPFAWMEQNPAASADSGSTLSAPTTDDSLDWLHDSSLLDEALGAEGLSVPDEFPSTGFEEWKPTGLDDEPVGTSAAPEVVPAEQGVPGAKRGLTSILSEANFDWMNKQDENIASEDEMDDWLNQFGTAEPKKSVTEAPDWLTDLDAPQTAEKENDAWFMPEEGESDSEFPATPEFPVGATSSEFPQMSGDDQADDDEFPLDSAEDADDDDTPDWAAELPGQEGDSDDEFAWMEDEPEAEASELPDWMSELAPKQDFIGAAAAVPPTEDDSVMGDAMPSWLDSITPEDANAVEPEAQSDDAYGWLSDEGHVKAGTEATISLSPSDFPWMAAQSEPEVEAEDEDEPSAEPAAVAGDTPDWLTALDPEQAITESTPETSDEFNWLDDSTLMTPEPEAKAEGETEPEPVGEFDWLTDSSLITGQVEAEAEAEAQAERAGEFSWLDDTSLAEDEDAGEAETEGEAVAGGTPDWLSAMHIPKAAGEPAAIDNDFTWMSAEDLNDEDEDEAVPLVTDPEFTWMAEEAEPETEVAAEGEPEAVAGSLPDWLAQMNPGDPENIAAQTETPVADSSYSWLNDESLEEAEAAAGEAIEWMPDAAPEAASVVSEVRADDLAWSSEPVLAEESEAAAEEAPDWLAELAPAAEAESEPAPAQLTETDMDWLSAAERAAEAAASLDPADTELEWSAEPIDSQEAAAVAGEAPDWLSELDPTAHVLAAEPQAEIPAEVLADAEYTWLNDESPAVDDDAVLEDEDFTWMTENDEDEELVAAAPIPIADEADVLSADTMPDWLSEVNPEAETEPTAAAAEDADWLRDIQPQADLAIPTPEVEESVAWLDEELEPEAPPEGVSDAVPIWAAVQSEETARDSEFGWLDDVEAEATANPDAGLSEHEQAALEQFEPLSADEWQSASEELAFDNENGWSVAEVEAEPAEAFDALDAVGEHDDDIFAESGIAGEADEEEALEPSHAHSAPDWLNAMVPGLDVDYEPGDDEPEEDGEPVAEAEQSEFAWVSDLVERETSATGLVQFTFSRPPRWFDGGAPVTQHGAKDDDLPDWPSDDADVDVPEWLR